ncbi:MAG: hypothetical protein AAF639_39395 [Chloroflexota bacterium]
MSSNTNTVKKNYFDFNIAGRIEAYLNDVARGFDRKSYNPPRDIIMYIKDVPHGWVDVGMIPEPKTRLGWFMYHFIHGWAMGYPLHRVLAFSLIHTKYDRS